MNSNAPAGTSEERLIRMLFWPLRHVCVAAAFFLPPEANPRAPRPSRMREVARRLCELRSPRLQAFALGQAAGGAGARHKECGARAVI